MKKLMNVMLIGVLMFSSVGQISASAGFDGPLDGNTPQEQSLMTKLKTDPRYALSIAGAAVAAYFGYYVAKTRNWFGLGEPTTAVEKKIESPGSKGGLKIFYEQKVIQDLFNTLQASFKGLKENKDNITEDSYFTGLEDISD